ncbi:MAG: alpha/beta fold hydrolase [Actinobacteria bacterium]|nr:alpha/beta fold hydrolase [Actinomycetota bacterium]
MADAEQGYRLAPFTIAGSRDVGVLFVHGFTGSPASVAPWARAVAAAGYTVSVIRLPGHGNDWREMNATTWRDWYQEVDRGARELLQEVDAIALAGFSMGGALALRYAAIHPEHVKALLLLNALHSLRKLWRDLTKHLKEVTTPTILFRSVQDHVVPAASCDMVLKSISSSTKREVLLEKSYHVAALDYDAPILESKSIEFLREFAPVKP